MTRRAPPSCEFLSAAMSSAQGGNCIAYRIVLREAAARARQCAAPYGLGEERIQTFVADVLTTVHSVRHTYGPAASFSQWLNAIIESRANALIPTSPRLAELTRIGA